MSDIAFSGQLLTHCPQPTHFFAAISGWEVECISSLPQRLPLPIPRFLSAPPNPVRSCPLKWLREMITSASAMALPILAVRHSSLSITTSRCSFPHSPSAMITSQPTVMRLKPFSIAEFRWSTALALFPRYRVLQSVRNGFPPFSLIIRTSTATKFGRT
ncbi:MAG: hypothetical protein A4E30_01281 [Methanomassiliicoccales archaeon PtaB.Bin215]|nr:MAG: hypothetical protein A4E30_01281 [Methanomassiliicoccales archaeon PtaB.Bin215]